MRFIVNKRGWGTVVAAILVLAATAGTTAAQTRLVIGPSMTPPGGALVAPGDPPALSLLYTGAVTGYVDVCG